LNLLLFRAEDRQPEDRIAVSDHRLVHLREVLRAGVGDHIRVGEVDGLIGDGELVELTPGRAVLKVALDQPPPPKLPPTLVLALPRPKMLRRILRSVAEFGVGELHLVNSYRVEKSYWQTPVLAPPTIEEYLLQGLEQSRDTMRPPVHCHQRFKPFVEDLLPGLVSGKRALLAHPGDYPTCPRGPDGQSILVIGPEGGFIPYEVDKLEQCGCHTVSLGPRILRVENAVNALVSRLH
jgi:16S rRNA (uracil1498-N3)-methyltransferase